MERRLMMRYLLDTALWCNSVTMPAVIPERIRKLIGQSDRKGLCTVSLLECAIHHRRGRLEFEGGLNDFFAVAIAHDIELIELTPAVALATNDLPKNFPGDPFDRTIAATAKVLNLTLITADEHIRDADFCQVEFYPFKPAKA
jgi:PIN domain nuclease of toxin-antitoxin system